MLDKQKIRTIAASVRDEMVDLQENYGDINRWDEDLGGMCAIASFTLCKALRKQKIDKVRFCASDRHCFVTVRDHIVDITASQFGEEPICILPSKREDLPYYWQPKHKIRRLTDVHRILKTWPLTQQPRILSDFAV